MQCYITEEKVRFGQMILYMNYDRVFNLQSWNAGKSKINYRYNYGFYEVFFYFESIFLTLLNLVGSLKIMLFSSKFWLGQKSHSPKTVFWLLTQFQLSNFSSYFSELGGSIVLTNHNFDTFFLWEIFFQWFWHFRLEYRHKFFS